MLSQQSPSELLYLLQGPSAAHPLGTDTFGRDVLSRLLFGAQVTLLAVLQALLIAAVAGVPFGLLAGFATQTTLAPWSRL